MQNAGLVFEVLLGKEHNEKKTAFPIKPNDAIYPSLANKVQLCPSIKGRLIFFYQG
jgi:hypothetical protein